ncbi:unnamed protein product [Pylaiella littoralis]
MYFESVSRVRLIRDIIPKSWKLPILSPGEFSRRACAELSVGSAFVQPMAQSISQQLIEHKRKFPGWTLEGMVAPAAENIQVLDIDVRFRSIIYRDQVRWDINCLHNSPERFARSTVADLNLPQEMEPTIALILHQQVSNHRMAAPSSISSSEGCHFKDIEGPCISPVQPVDQNEFNARNWKHNR